MAKQNILLIDDDETILEILKKTLENNGYTYLSANNGQEGLNTLKEHQDNIDAVILDIMMPEMDGRQTLEKIRNDETTKELPILMLTGENQLSDVSECLKLGANDYMVKPFDPPTCIARLQKILPPPPTSF